MRINLVAIGQKMPSWITEGYKEYAQRMPHECSVNLIEVAAEKRSKNTDLKSVVNKEGKRLLAAIPKNALIIAMQITGQPWSTEQLSDHMQDWMHDGRDIALLVGGPEGLADSCSQQADLSWSLSPLTLPHPMVRVIISEQLFRAWSIIKKHPYHRGA